jgi:hypothetical protein
MFDQLDAPLWLPRRYLGCRVMGNFASSVQLSPGVGDVLPNGEGQPPSPLSLTWA